MYNPTVVAGRIIILLMIAVMITMIAAQCGAPASQIQLQQMEYEKARVFNDGEETPLYRAIDYEAGVVCWWIGVDGIDCLSIEDTKLKYRE